MKIVKLSKTHIASITHSKISEKLTPVLLRKTKGLYNIYGRDKKRTRKSTSRRPNDVGLIQKQPEYERQYLLYQEQVRADLRTRKIIRIPKVLKMASSVLTQEQILGLIILWSFRTVVERKRVSHGYVFAATLKREMWGTGWKNHHTSLMKRLLPSLKDFVRADTTPSGRINFWFVDGWVTHLETLVKWDAGITPTGRRNLRNGTPESRCGTPESQDLSGYSDLTGQATFRKDCEEQQASERPANGVGRIFSALPNPIQPGKRILIKGLKEREQERITRLLRGGPRSTDAGSVGL